MYPKGFKKLWQTGLYAILAVGGLIALVTIVWAAIPSNSPVLYSAMDIVTMPTGTTMNAQAMNVLGGFTANGPVALTGILTPPQITADQNDYNPTNLGTASFLRISTNSSYNLTGLVGGTDGRLLTMHNIGAQPLVLLKESVLSSAANRFSFPTDLTLAANGMVILQYDGGSIRWRSVSGGMGTSTVAEDVLDDNGELLNPAVATNSFIINGTIPPPAGSCPHDHAFYRNTSSAGDVYVCNGLGQNWHIIGENDVTVAAIIPELGATVQAVGPTNITLTGTAPLRFSGNNTTKTITTIFTGEKCGVIDNVTFSDDAKLLVSFVSGATITSVWCNYEGSAPTTAATFTLSDGAGNAMTITGSSPTCTAKATTATAAAVTAANVLTAREPLLFSVSNTPNPSTDTYMLCVGYTIP